MSDQIMQSNITDLYEESSAENSYFSLLNQLSQILRVKSLQMSHNSNLTNFTFHQDEVKNYE